VDAEAQIEGFIAKFSDPVAAEIRAARADMRRRLPGAFELVYDNYNALAIGYGPTEKASEAIFSIALFPRWVSLFFLQGKGLPDPQRLLKGSGNVAKHVVVSSPEMINDPEIRTLMKESVARAKVPLDPANPHRLIIKSISAKQRPRRPAKAAKSTRTS
jgi:hypothetical protein